VVLRCEKCGKCCEAQPYILVSLFDLLRIAEVGIEPDFEIRFFYFGGMIDGVMPFLKLMNPCPYFDSAKKLCEIHQVKPLVCIIFPWSPIFSFSERARSDCPLFQKIITKRETIPIPKQSSYALQIHDLAIHVTAYMLNLPVYDLLGDILLLRGGYKELFDREEIKPIRFSTDEFVEKASYFLLQQLLTRNILDKLDRQFLNTHITVAINIKTSLLIPRERQRLKKECIRKMIDFSNTFGLDSQITKKIMRFLGMISE